MLNLQHGSALMNLSVAAWARLSTWLDRRFRARSSSQEKTIQLVVIIAGYGMRLGHMAVHAALHHLSRVVSSVHSNLFGADSFEIDTAAVEIEKKIVSALHWTIHVCGVASGLRFCAEQCSLLAWQPGTASFEAATMQTFDPSRRRTWSLGLASDRQSLHLAHLAGASIPSFGGQVFILAPGKHPHAHEQR